MTGAQTPFAARLSVQQVEGALLAPNSGRTACLPAVTTDAASGEVPMMGVMNEDALLRTIETGQAHYWSRSRQTLWHKGATSGLSRMSSRSASTTIRMRSGCASR